jgi:UDP-N-acetyl-2-amino-2-deoxyglucuronate dehydrogenase
MKNFALIGAAGYIAPRHLKAIKDTGNNLVAALDPFDSVGIMDKYFPEADFFTEFERFDRHIEKIKRQGTNLDYVSICTPNYLHDAHIRFGLNQGADVICEKPIVLNPWNLEALQEKAREKGKTVYNILQLRLHQSVIKLKKKIENGPKNKKYDIDLAYLTSRGHWYYTSWKGYENKSGGIATNIGVHFFDMLGWIFGNVQENIVHIHTHDRASGYLEFEKARVRWFLSINYNTIPEEVREKGLRTYRAIKIQDETFEFSGGFTELHTKSYKHILDGEGFLLEDAKQAINIVYDIRHQRPIGLKGNYHPFAKLPLAKHPFTV